MLNGVANVSDCDFKIVHGGIIPQGNGKSGSPSDFTSQDATVKSVTSALFI